MCTSKTARRRFLPILSSAYATLAGAMAHAATVAPQKNPLVDAALTAAVGGICCFLVNAAPMIQQPFKAWSSWFILAATAIGIFYRLS